MFHLIPFAAGIAVGAVAVKVLRGGRAKEEAAKASECLREAAVGGLGAVEKSAGKLKEKLSSGFPAGAPAGAAAKPVAAKKAARPAAAED